MAGTRDIQNAFNAGELSPLLFGRSDLATYNAGLKTCQNWLLLKPGGIERRPGTKYVSDCFRQDVASRLIRFHVDQQNSFAIELSELFFTVKYQGASLVLASYQVNAVNGVDVGTNEFLLPNHGYFHQAGPFRVAPIGAGVLPAGLAAATDYYIDLPQNGVITGVNTTTDRWACANNYSEGQGPFRLNTTGSLPTAVGLSATVDVYVKSPTPFDFLLSLTPGGATLDLTAPGSGSHTLVPTPTYLRQRFRLASSPGGTIVNITGVGAGLFALAPQVEIVSRFPHPYLADELNEVDHAQSGDVMYLAHQFVPPQKLVRHNNQQWSCETVEFYDGPYFFDQESFPGVVHEGVTITPTALTGTRITFTASSGIFRGTDVGRLIRWAPSGTPLRWGWGVIVGVSPIEFTNADFGTIVATNVEWNAAADQINNSVAHNILDGEPIKWDQTAGGVTANQLYYCHRISATQISLHNTLADALADTNRVNLSAIGASQNGVTGRFTKTGHGIVGRVGPITLATTGTLPGGLALATQYWVDAVDANSLQFSTTPGAQDVCPNSPLTGSGTHSFSGAAVPATIALVDIKETMISGGASQVWRLGAWGSAVEIGYPKAVCFHEQRLVFAASVAEPQTMFFSVSGDFENHSPDVEEAATGDHLVEASSGLVLTMGSDEASRILWMSPLRVLVVGCLDGPWILQAPVSEAISAIDLPVTRRQARVGLGDVKPVPSSVALLFTAHAPGYAYAAAFDVDQDAIVPTDLMVLASHLADHGAITRLALSGPPLDTIWMVRADGVLLALTFDPVQEITAWSRFILGASQAGPAVVESVCTVSDATDGDQLWVTVRRTINGQTKRTVEVMAKRFRTQTPQEDAHFVDGGVDVTFGSPQTVVPGLAQLEGETVAILADGAVVPSKVVSGGQVTLDVAATRVHVGLPYTSLAEMLPAEISARFGFQIAMVLKRVVRAMLRIHRTLGLKVGKDANNLSIVDLRSLYADELDQPVPLRTGVVEVPGTAGWERDGIFAFGSSDPLPCQVLAVMERLEWADR